MLSVGTKFLLVALFCCSCSALQVKDRYFPRYHLAPPGGWMNDPNGLSQYQDEYHFFYQHNPRSSHDPQQTHWGHATSRDMLTWKHQPIALSPDKPYDIDGVWSGSTVVDNNTMYLLYTGNVAHPEQVQVQALATSTDGKNFIKYERNPVLAGEEFQPNIRDPKVWKHGDLYFMVLGHNLNDYGRVLLFSSNDLLSWKLESVIGESDGTLGYMWECPDFFELDGYFVLLVSPQGMEAQGDKYKNSHVTGYIVGNFNYETYSFEPVTGFIELDNGHDIYASQTFTDNKNRTILVSWCGMWDRKYPDQDDGFSGQLTIPRVLSLTEDLRIIQKPVEEICDARGSTLYSGKAKGGQTVQLEDKSAEIEITASKNQNFNVFIESANARVSISYDMSNNKVTLDRGGEDGIRRTDWTPADKLELYMLVDASSIELFCGDFEVAFSSRFFPDGDVQIRLGDNVEVDNLVVTSIKRTVEMP